MEIGSFQMDYIRRSSVGHVLLSDGAPRPLEKTQAQDRTGHQERQRREKYIYNPRDRR